MKTFFIHDDGKVGRHKTTKANIVGFGVLHEDQKIVVHTTSGRKLSLYYNELKIGSRQPTIKVLLDSLEKIYKIDIITIGEEY